MFKTILLTYVSGCGALVLALMSHLVETGANEPPSGKGR